MANLPNCKEKGGAMLMLETQQRDIGTKTTAVTTNSGTSSGETPSSLITIGGARFHQHTPVCCHHGAPSSERNLQPDCPAPLPTSDENLQETSVSQSPSTLHLVHEDVAASYAFAASTTASTLGGTSAARSEGMDGDIRKCGYLRKQKHGHKRFFVLRGPSHMGPSRLEYYDSEKKFRNSLRSAASTSSTACPPKRVIYLYQCFTVNKRADAKNKYLIALYTKDEYFAMVAESEQEQEDWYQVLSGLMSEGKKGHLEADELDDGYGTVSPGAVFKEVWQVNVKPKGLGQTKNLTGVYRLCLSAKSIHLMKLNSETPCVNLQLMNIRRCGHSESFFFIEVGRSSSIGPGEIWMQVDDSVVAQSMHETILETMKALKAFTEFRPRSKSQSSGSNPIAFITTRRHLGNLPPSQTGLQRRPRTESMVGTPPASKSSGASSYRFRTSSEGEGTMSRPYRSATGSLVHLGSARVSLGRQEGCGRYVRALPGASYHARSASLPVSHFPSNSSPVSVSSSSGHGSASDALTRPSSASICGSPSDGGFASSDEYGSSPCDFRYFRVRSNTPDSLGNTPPIREENSLSDYMAMDRSETPRDEVAFEDRAVGKLTCSSKPPSITAGGVATATYQKTTQTTPSLDDPATDTSSLGRKGQQTCLSSVNSGDGSYSDHYCRSQAPSLQDDCRKPKDDGYMPMMPGVVPSHNADYVPMQPSAHLPAPAQSQSAAAPPSSQQTDTHGYMVMFPGGSCSPVQAGLRGGGGAQLKDGEYMDMSQGGVGATRHPGGDGYYGPATPETPKSYSSYFSLPRSYKAPTRDSHGEYMPMSSPAKPPYSENDLAPPPGLHNGCAEMRRLDKQAVRPTRLSLDQQQASDPADPALPPSPGEYIDIDFRERRAYTPGSLSTDGSPSSLGSAGEHRPSPLHDDYMSLEADGHPPKAPSPRLSLVAPWNPPSYSRPLASAPGLGATGGQADDYTEMMFGLSGGAECQAMPRRDSERRYPSLPPRSPQREPKVIRADPQGRRRHSSETFSSSSPSAAAANSSPTPAGAHLTDSSKWHSSASFDSVCLQVEGADLAPGDTACSPARGTCRSSADAFHNCLNYIALDLREEPQSSCGAPLPPPSSPPASHTLAENGAYASIDFSKSEVLTSVSKD